MFPPTTTFILLIALLVISNLVIGGVLTYILVEMQAQNKFRNSQWSELLMNFTNQRSVEPEVEIVADPEILSIVDELIKHPLFSTIHARSNDLMKRPKRALLLLLCRFEKNLTQSTLARELSIAQGDLSRWERGVTSMPPKYLKKVAKILEVSPETLLGNTIK